MSEPTEQQMKMQVIHAMDQNWRQAEQHLGSFCHLAELPQEELAELVRTNQGALVFVQKALAIVYTQCQLNIEEREESEA